MKPQLYCFCSVLLILLVLFPATAGSSFQQENPKNPHCTPPAKSQMEVSNYLVNVMQNLAAKKPDVCLRRLQIKTTKKETEYWT